VYEISSFDASRCIGTGCHGDYVEVKVEMEDEDVENYAICECHNINSIRSKKHKYYYDNQIKDYSGQDM
jgi:hypothetical protein